MVRFIHTADWQIGKPFARVSDPEKRTLLRQERIAAVERIGTVARERNAAFVLVAGDIFDTDCPDNSTVSAACRAIGGIGLPVLAIPGNHDHAGPGTIWEQTFFKREQESLAPNFTILSKPEPFAIAGAVVLPCPLQRRHESGDVTEWLRNRAPLNSTLPQQAPRIVLAHGSVQGFSGASDSEESASQTNSIDLTRLPAGEYDYIALGDWHGTKQINDRAWYSGTPELDRFEKGPDHNPGNILLVELPARSQPPAIESIRIASFNWHEEVFNAVQDDSLDSLEPRLDSLLGNRVHRDLLKLTLIGTLGCAGELRLKDILTRLDARLLRLKLDNQVQIEPSDEEITALTSRSDDPLISALAKRLIEQQRTAGAPAEAEKARRALRILYTTLSQRGALS